jgi:hypothetical protein
MKDFLKLMLCVLPASGTILVTYIIFTTYLTVWICNTYLGCEISDPLYSVFIMCMFSMFTRIMNLQKTVDELKKMVTIATQPPPTNNNDKS